MPTHSRPGPEVDTVTNQSSSPASLSFWKSEDAWAMIIGAALLMISFLAVWLWIPKPEISKGDPSADPPKVAKISSPLKAWLSTPGKWKNDPYQALVEPATDKNPANDRRAGLIGAFGVLWIVGAIAARGRALSPFRFSLAFPALFALALFAYLLSSQELIKASNLEYALWALLVGLLISNTITTPRWLKPAMQTEFYVKTGLVLLGAEVLMSRLLVLGVPGVFVAWVVTPIVLIGTYIFGQRVLRMPSRSLNMVISADMSVCGVSAAIATSAACRAKKEELSLAIGISLIFTVVMMVVMPIVIRTLGINSIVGGAWMGGTIDSTGAVAAAGESLGEQALEVASAVKMIQNILIGVVAFGVALYWVSYVEKDPQGSRPGVSEIWRRFPKFVLGFVAMSILFSLLHSTLPQGPEIVDASIKGSSATLRGWLFCLAFVSIGLETNFRELAPLLKSGKPLILYLVGQSFNLALTLLMAWLMFDVIFHDWVLPVLPKS